MSTLTDAERVSRWFKLADKSERSAFPLTIHLKDAALRCEQLSQELGLAKLSLSEWLEGSRGPFSLQEHDIRERIRKILGESSLLRQAAAGFAAAGFAAVGCPACGAHEPDQCTCTQAERAAAQAKLDGRP